MRLPAGALTGGSWISDGAHHNQPRACEHPQGGPSFDLIYEKLWALALLEQAVARLGEEQKAEGKARQFEQLKPYLSAEAMIVDYDRAAWELGTSRDSVKMAVSRLRKRYRDLVREEVAHTVAGPDEVREEMRSLFRVLSR